jgi:SAM-dependent methyltransferase
VPDESVHLRRDRAESFGAVADDYDRYRPSYPAALIDDLIATRPATALDVGCGTGKAGALLAARGVRVLGVEVDAQMAAVARGHGLAVEVSTFEDWDARGRIFDLLTAGQSWHWVDPQRGARKAGRVLNRGGRLALFWNHRRVHPAFDAVYAVHAPELRERGTDSAGFLAHRPYVAELRASGAFTDVVTRDYSFQLTHTAAEWAGLVGTHSDHLLLGPERLRALASALRETIEDMGGTVTMPAGTHLVLAVAG